MLNLIDVLPEVDEMGNIPPFSERLSKSMVTQSPTESYASSFICVTNL